jgi:hypothetical protein
MYRLNTQELDIIGYFASAEGALCVNSISFQAGNTALSRLGDEALIKGVLLNLNTAQEFKDFDKKAWIETAGADILEAIRSGQYLANPNLLSQFRVLSFADLKSHIFTYWFAFPALVSSDVRFSYKTAPRRLVEVLDPGEISDLYRDLSALISSSSSYASSSEQCTSESESDNTFNRPMTAYGLLAADADGRRLVVTLDEAWKAYSVGRQGVTIITFDIDIPDDGTISQFILLKEHNSNFISYHSH